MPYEGRHRATRSWFGRTNDQRQDKEPRSDEIRFDDLLVDTGGFPVIGRREYGDQS